MAEPVVPRRSPPRRGEGWGGGSMNDPGPRGRHRGRDPEGREAAGGEAARGPRPGPARQGRGRLPGGGGHGGCGNPRPGAHRLRLLRPHGERSQGLPGGRRHRGSGRHGRGQGIGPLLLAKVVGTVVATRKDEGLTGTKLLVIQPLKTDHRPAGKPLVAVDSVGAGPGEEVFYVKGREASFPFLPAEVPADATIIGIVDHWSLA